jgi:NADH-quinone oxidoreductase subunit E
MHKNLDKIFSSFSGKKEEVIPILQEVQEELGYLPEEALRHTAGFVGLPYSRVYGVATFYARFHLNPRGRNIIRLCCGTACHVRGAKKVSDKIADLLQVGVGETTANMNFTFEEVACIGACGLAPVMTINDKTFGKLEPDKAVNILEAFDETGEGDQP